MECISLRDAESGTSARILASFGFNCFEFRVPHQDGQLDVIWSADGFETGSERASGSGTPILFPFPGRIPGTVFRWQGRDYELPSADGRGNAIHGFVLDRAWRVVEQTAASVTGQFQASRDDPQLLDRWPADFRITVSYTLGNARLETHILVENPDNKPLPCGLGTHPYFRLPLGGDRAEDCLVRLPVSEQWELRDMLPTGARAPIPEAASYQAGRTFADLKLDAVFTGLEFTGPSCCASISDPQSGVTLQLEFDKVFRECVVYTPPHREAICIEPYTCLPGGLSLDGVDNGLRVLGPGESMEANVSLGVR